jgi:exonuclease SbcC
MGSSIKSLKLTNFKQHKNVTLEFGQLNVILGENGSGKTSILEAICYALYGSVPSSATKKELVHLGKKSGSVELTLDDGYRIVRDLDGSNVLYNDEIKVSEKAQEIEDFLNIDKGVFMNILYASQSDIYSYFMKFNAKEKDFVDSIFNIDNLLANITESLTSFRRGLEGEILRIETMKMNKDTMYNYVSAMFASLDDQSIVTLEQIVERLAVFDDELKRMAQISAQYQQINSANISYSNLNSKHETLLNMYKTCNDRVAALTERVEQSKKALEDFVLQLRVTNGIEVDPNNLNAFNSFVAQQTNIHSYIDSLNKVLDTNIANLAELVKNNQTLDLAAMQTLLNQLQTAKQYVQVIFSIDQYRSYYVSIQNTIKDLIHKHNMTIQEATSNKNDVDRFAKDINTITQQLEQSKAQLDTVNATTQPLDNYNTFANLYAQKQKQYTQLKTTHSNLVSYQEQLSQMIVDEDRLNELKAIKNDVELVNPIFARDGFLSHLRTSLLNDIASSVGTSLETFGFTKLLPVTVNKSGTLGFHGRHFRSLSGVSGSNS